MTTNNQGVGTRELALDDPAGNRAWREKSYRAQTGAGKISVSVQAGPCISDQACRRDNRAEDRTGLYYQPVFKSKDRKNETGDPQYPALCGLSDQIHGSGSGFGSHAMKQSTLLSGKALRTCGDL